MTVKESFKVFEFVDVENLHMFIEEGMTYELDDSYNQIYYCEYEANDHIDALQMMYNMKEKGFNVVCECEKGLLTIEELEEVFN
jgi:hypothetical protein